MKIVSVLMLFGLVLVSGCGEKKEETSQLANLCTYIDNVGYNYTAGTCYEANRQCQSMGYGGCRLHPSSASGGSSGGSSGGGSTGWCTYVDTYGYNYGASTCAEASRQCQSMGYGGCRRHPNG